MLPVKMLEYAALGIPIIAARLRTAEYYFDRASVRFFEAGNAEALADAIRELRADRERAARLARRARRVAASLSWERQRERYFDAIDSLLHRPEEGRKLAAHGPRPRGSTNDNGRREASGADRR
jgi:glycosyltransferase involved in cell wall biosynthesis